MLRVHFLQHVPFEGPGNIAVWLAARGAAITTSRIWCGDPLPDASGFDWLVVMGGPMGADDEAQHAWLAPEKRSIESAIANGKHVLGICLGAQLVARVLGAKVTRNRYREIGWFPIERVAGAGTSVLGRALPARAEVFHWHGDTFELPEGALALARSAACEQQAFALGERVLALQFHLETTPAAARALVENAPGDLAPGPFVQSRDAMLGDAERFARLEPLLSGVLAAFAGNTRD